FRVDEDRVRPYFSKNGLSNQPTPFRISAKTYVPFVTPAWVERSVMYQIFPDRFENGDKRNDPKGVQPWNAEPTYSNRFGGDVAGVAKRLGYLKGLGIGNVYFNPVFASPSNHRYDTTDYKRVDPEFGTNDEFVSLVRQMKAAGIRTVLDFAFNHTATDHPFFVDLIEKGAESPYREWYYPKSFPIVVKENPPYEAWYGFPLDAEAQRDEPADEGVSPLGSGLLAPRSRS
ncbi:MAG: alpha-glycosidase, partial [Armatimonadota bacterium]